MNKIILIIILQSIAFSLTEKIYGNFTGNTDAENVQFGCRDHKGQLVDWYVLYKFPLDTPLTGSGNTLYSNGLRYSYITSNTINDGWILSNVQLNDINSHLNQTLQQKQNPVIEHYFTYNDQPYPKTRKEIYNSYAHSKGTVWRDDQGAGFWLVHSLPKFIPNPLIKSSWILPTSTKKNGQIFFCVSFKDLELWKAINDHLNYINVRNPYVKENVEIFENGETITELSTTTEIPPQTVQTSLQFKPNDITHEFKLYSKRSSLMVDIYEDVAKHLGTKNMYYSTWNSLKGMSPGRNKDVCAARMNAGFIDNNQPIRLTIEWDTICHDQIDNANERRYRRDHSKWAVTLDLLLNYICFGDLNRRTDNSYPNDYHNAGGGLLCFQNNALATYFNNLVIEFTEIIDGKNKCVPRNSQP